MYARVALRAHIVVHAKVEKWAGAAADALFDQLVKGHAVGQDDVLFDEQQVVERDIPALHTRW